MSVSRKTKLLFIAPQLSSLGRNLDMKTNLSSDPFMILKIHDRATTIFAITAHFLKTLL